MPRLLEPGTYDGKIKNYGISQASTGAAQAFIEFEIPLTEGRAPVKLTWFGGLSDEVIESTGKSPMEYTASTLLDCKFSGEAVELMAAGPQTNLIPIDHVMALVIEDHEYNGKTYSRIKYVNATDRVSGLNTLDHEQAATKFNVDAMRAMILKKRQEMEAKGGPKGEAAPSAKKLF